MPILRNIQRVDPVTGAFIYDYLGADGSGKYEVRFPNGTVRGNFTFINDLGEQETRSYSAGERGTEISGDGVVSPAPPTLVDETTGANYVDLGNYELYRHLEEPYVHIEGPSHPDERGQLSAQAKERLPEADNSRLPVQPILPLDHDDQARFLASSPGFNKPLPNQRATVSQPKLRSQPQATSSQSRRKRPQAAVPQPRFSRTQGTVPQPQRVVHDARFNAGQLDHSNPNALLDSLIGQFA